MVKFLTVLLALLAMPISAKADDEMLRDLILRARLSDALGAYAEAENAYRQVLTLQAGSTAAARGDTMMSLALEASNQGRFDEAGELFRAAEALVQQSTDQIDEARLLGYLAVDAANRHAYAEARDLARRATRSRREIAGGNDLVSTRSVLPGAVLAWAEITQSRMVEAAMSLRLGDLTDAAAAAEEALTITGTVRGVPVWWRGDALLLLAEVESARGNSDRARSLAQQGVSSLRQAFGESRPLALALLSVGRVQAASGDYPAAMAAFRNGLAMLRALPGGYGRIGFDIFAAYFHTALEIAGHDSAQHDALLDEAFIALQMIQGGGATEITRRAFLRLGQNQSRFAARLRDLDYAEKARGAARLALAEEASKNSESRSMDRETWLAAEYRHQSARAAAARADLKSYPEFVHADGGTASLASVRSVLRPGEGFAAFAFGRETGIVFVATQTAIEARLLPLSATRLAEAVRDLREGVTLRAGRVGDYDTALAYRLYRRLIAPVEDALVGVNHLIVADSGPLASLPLAALVTREPDTGKPAWLIERFALSRIPAATALIALRQGAHPSGGSLPFLGIGAPGFSGQEVGPGLAAMSAYCRGEGPVPPDMLRALPALPETGDEVRRVGVLLGARDGDLLLGGRANEPALRNRSLAEYRILYFATHGLLPAELRCSAEPALALAPPAAPAAARDGDGLLEASEIAGLRLDADLVVLSACNTATASGRFGGETLSSLADVFLSAGSRAVLASHWAVPSEATASLMTRMFSAYAAAPGMGYAAALQHAQIALAAATRTAHPVDWAGFTLIGDLPPTLQTIGGSP